MLAKTCYEVECLLSKFNYSTASSQVVPLISTGKLLRRTLTKADITRGSALSPRKAFIYVRVYLSSLSLTAKILQECIRVPICN